MKLTFQLYFGYLLFIICHIINVECNLSLIKAISHPSASICLVVEEEKNDTTLREIHSSIPSFGLFLYVSYTSSGLTSEAGRSVFPVGQLKAGQHNVTYKHGITDNTHNLVVLLNGKEHSFVKSSKPHWESVSEFQEVAIKARNNIRINCHIEIQKFSHGNAKHYRRKKHRYNNRISNHVSKENASLTYSNLESDGRIQDLPEIKSEEPHPLLPVTNNKLVKSDQQTGPKFTESLLEEVEASRPKQCSGSSCGNYMVIYILMGALGCLLVVAVVIATTFHYKKRSALRQEMQREAKFATKRLGSMREEETTETEKMVKTFAVDGEETLAYS